MVGLIVRHRVKDYAVWKLVFDEHGDVRRKYGALGHQVYRDLDDPATITVVNTFRDADGAQRFAQDPSLKEVMERAGVISEPQLFFAEQADTADYPVAVG